MIAAASISPAMLCDQKRPAAAGQDHDPDRHQGSQRVKTTDEVQDHEGEKKEVRSGAKPAYRTQELWVRAFEDQRPEQGGDREE